MENTQQQQQQDNDYDFDEQSLDDFIDIDYEEHSDVEPDYDFDVAPPSHTIEKLNNVSEEQMLAIQHIMDGANVIVDSVSGSGKSTTILSCAKMMPHKQFLQITYNSMLRKEVLAKVDSLKITNIQVHTFHSLAVRYYYTNAHTDSGIRKIMYDDLPPREPPLPQFDIIVLDEAQDISFLYYQFMVKFAFNMGSPFQIFILGDYKQALYQFKGSDERFLTMAEQIWMNHPLLSSPIFHHCQLRTSYRITQPMSDFVNYVMLGDERLVAVKAGDPVIYIRNSRRNLERIVVSQIQLLLAEGAKPDDIFVLGASVKGANSNIRKMENYLVEQNIPCYVPMFDTEKIDEKVITGKIVFSTFHSVKGRERKYVFVMGFDQTYFSFYAANLPKDECPNTLYVACTRATHKLYLLESDQYTTDRPLDFLKLDHFQMKTKPYISFRGTPQKVFYVLNEAAAENAAKKEFYDVSPTDLIKFVPETVIEHISPLLDKIFIKEKEAKPEMEIAIPTMIQTKRGLFEDISDLNGIAIPSIYYDHIYRIFDQDSNVSVNILLKIIHNVMDETREHEYSYLKEIISMLPDYCNTAGEYLYLANVFVSAKEKLYFKLKQIEDADYVWLTDDIVSQCVERLDEIIGSECGEQIPQIEHSIINGQMEEETNRINRVLSPFFENMTKKFRFHARADLITHKCIWELKCTTSISIEHMLQVVIYQWLWIVVANPSLGGNPTMSPPNTKKLVSLPLRILNIKTGEILLLNASFEQLTTIVVELLKGKYTDILPKTDEEFIQECSQFMNETIHQYIAE